MSATWRSTPRKAVVIGSLGYSLVNFRLNLMRRLQANGFEVTAIAAEMDSATIRDLEANGILWREIPMQRTGTNPFSDVATLRALLSALRQLGPDLVISYTMKPILYGSLAAYFARVPGRFALFTGLGYAFMEDAPDERRRRVRNIAILLHRAMLSRLTGAFCYNAADRADIRRFRLIPDNVPLWDVAGSGVDTDAFAPANAPDGPVRFLFVGRLLRSKGLPVLAEAARILRRQGRAPNIDVVGPTDSNPDAIDRDEVAGWEAEGLIRWHGATRDVRPYLAASHVFVLPTELREGVPRSILEAMSCGRAVITTDGPGCAETVVDGETGIVVGRGDAADLAAAMARLMDAPELAARMGAAGRSRACERHDVHRINGRLLSLMGVEERSSPASEGFQESGRADAWAAS